MVGIFQVLRRRMRNLSAMRNVLFHNRLDRNGEISPHKMRTFPRNFRKMADVGCVIFHEFSCAPPRGYAWKMVRWCLCPIFRGGVWEALWNAGHLQMQQSPTIIGKRSRTSSWHVGRIYGEWILWAWARFSMPVFEESTCITYNYIYCSIGTLANKALHKTLNPLRQFGIIARS